MEHVRPEFAKADGTTVMLGADHQLRLMGNAPASMEMARFAENVQAVLTGQPLPHALNTPMALTMERKTDGTTVFIESERNRGADQFRKTPSFRRVLELTGELTYGQGAALCAAYQPPAPKKTRRPTSRHRTSRPATP